MPLKLLQPGFYTDDTGTLHIVPSEALRANGYSDTPANRAMFEKVVKDMFPGAPVEYVNNGEEA